MPELEDVTMCGICSEPFKHGEVAVQAARWWTSNAVPVHLRRVEKLWAHAVCVFAFARENRNAFRETKVKTGRSSSTRCATAAHGLTQVCHDRTRDVTG
jgi:hypothetical protein